MVDMALPLSIRSGSQLVADWGKRPRLGPGAGDTERFIPEICKVWRVPGAVVVSKANKVLHGRFHNGCGF